MNKTAELQLVMRLHVTLEKAVSVGETPQGTLNIIPITGGTVESDGFTATVCRGGADWNTVLPNGLNHVYARYWLMDDAGEIICVENEGIIDWKKQNGPYITTPRFTCAANSRHADLNSGVYTGELTPGGEDAVNIVFWRIVG
ncbi:MAG: DUF3237 domain-containing protein [Clostridia bacterium]|nr:DUF3237 domain-containing protein [Clostridia bacterium]